MNDSIALITCGPADHGITTFGRQLAAAVRSHGFDGTVLHEPDPANLVDLTHRILPDVRLVHLQANDWLFSAPDRRADSRIAECAAILRGRGAALSVTLHDLPQQGVSPALYLRRAEVYSNIVQNAVGVVVSSHHERHLLGEAKAALTAEDLPTGRSGLPADIEVIPLPIDRRPGPVGVPDPAARATIAVLGFIYPGKGHLEILEAAADLPASVLAIGRPSAGHEHLLAELVRRGAQLGTDFSCTGFVADADLTRTLRDITVPVAPHPQVSASASINSWIAAGRRPLVLAGRYTRELRERMPGSVWLYEAGQLRSGLRSALDDPRLTRLPPAFPVDPDLDEVGSRYLSWLRSTSASIS